MESFDFVFMQWKQIAEPDRIAWRVFIGLTKNRYCDIASFYSFRIACCTSRQMCFLFRIGAILVGWRFGCVGSQPRTPPRTRSTATTLRLGTSWSSVFDAASDRAVVADDDDAEEM